MNSGLNNTAAKCPSCRSTFEVPIWMQNNVTAPPNPPKYTVLRRTPAYVRDSIEELLPEVLNSATDISAARAQNIAALQSSISISTTPEYNVLGLGAKDAFYVRVGIHYQEQLSPTASDTSASNTSLAVGNPSAGIASTAIDPIAPSSTVPLDIVCVLDNSGSMTGSKLASLKTAMNFVIQSLGPNDR